MRRAAESALAVCGAGVVVVLGAVAEECAAQLQGLPIRLAVNEDWQSGKGSSLQYGIAAAQEGAPQGLLVTLVDQPLVTASDLARLAERWCADPSRPVAAAYGDGAGVPAILPTALLDGLDALSGDHGAQAVLNRAEGLQTVPLPHAAHDVDTPEDWRRLSQ